MKFTTNISSDFKKLAKMPEKGKRSLVNFAATDFDTLKGELIRYIKAVYPTEYNYFAESDIGVMLLELVAYMGSINSMKVDMLANENFLATATQRKSIAKLLDLVGVRLRGPLSSAADIVATFSASSTEYNIPVANRVFTAVSPEDGGTLNFTLYKVVNGKVDYPNADGSLVLYDIESDPSVDSLNPVGFSNLVVQEGSLVTDSGSFASTESLKIIVLGSGPVIDGSVQVFMTSEDSTVGGAYSEVQNLFQASGTTDKIFEISYDSDFNATVVFGDGTAGVSPGISDTYFVSYRIGGGNRGNLLPESITGTLTANEATATIRNPTPATGGSNAETADHAKRWGPLTFARQDRVVTLEDYVVFANNHVSDFGTVGKATATTRKAYSYANIIDLYILEKASDNQLQKAVPNFKISLLDALNIKKMVTDEVVVSDGLIRTLDLVVTIKIDKLLEPQESTVMAKVRDKIVTFFNIDNQDMGDSLNLSDLNRTIFEVPEVRFSNIDNLTSDVPVLFNEIIQLNNLTIRADYLA
jgi:hypothetical protein